MTKRRDHNVEHTEDTRVTGPRNRFIRIGKRILVDNSAPRRETR